MPSLVWFHCADVACSALYDASPLTLSSLLRRCDGCYLLAALYPAYVNNPAQVEYTITPTTNDAVCNAAGIASCDSSLEQCVSNGSGQCTCQGRYVLCLVTLLCPYQYVSAYDRP
jgi:hypothetical protein